MIDLGLKNKFYYLYEKINTSLWFRPLVLALIGFLLAIGFLYLDINFDDFDQLGKYSLIFSSDAQTAVTILSTLTSSTATIISLILSMTMISFVISSSQYGPRLLRNFISDKNSQNFIGMFIAVFVFDITVVSRIDSGDEAYFVPTLSITVAILFSIFSMLVLMFFVDHVAGSLRIESLVKEVSDEMLTVMKRALSKKNEKDSDKVYKEDTEFVDDLRAEKSGYIQKINYSDLADLANENDLLLKFEVRPGHFVIKDQSLLKVNATVSDDLREGMLSQISSGTFKTASQDVEYTIDQLVEISLVALSTGVNKSFTAIACIDRLSELLSLAYVEKIQDEHVCVEEKLCLIKYPVTFEDLLKACFDQIRQNSTKNLAVSIHLINSLQTIISISRENEKTQIIKDYIKEIYETVDREALSRNDIKDLEKSASR